MNSTFTIYGYKNIAKSIKYVNKYEQNIMYAETAFPRERVGCKKAETDV